VLLADVCLERRQDEGVGDRGWNAELEAQLYSAALCTASLRHRPPTGTPSEVRCGPRSTFVMVAGR
jgi:hypothetical protein